jgi:hypothetical protein
MEHQPRSFAARERCMITRCTQVFLRHGGGEFSGPSEQEFVQSLHDLGARYEPDAFAKKSPKIVP